MKKSERIRQEYIDMFRKSWTYELMAEPEKHEVIDELQSVKLDGRGSVKTIGETLGQIYKNFLDGIGYTGYGWRGGQ